MAITYLVPGGGYVNAKQSGAAYLIPGVGYFDDPSTGISYAAIAVTQGADTASVTGAEVFTATAAVTQGADVASVSGSETFSASVTLTQTANVASVIGNFGSGITGVISALQAYSSVQLFGMSSINGFAAISSNQVYPVALNDTWINYIAISDSPLSAVSLNDN